MPGFYTQTRGISAKSGALRDGEMQAGTSNHAG